MALKFDKIQLGYFKLQLQKLNLEFNIKRKEGCRCQNR